MKAVPKSILMTTETVGGVWPYALELAQELGKYKIEVALATMGPRPSRLQRADASAIRNVDLFESNYKLEWSRNSWSDMLAAGEWLISLEDRLQPDLIHLNGYAHAALPWKNPKVVVGHSCVFSWWRAVRFDGPPTEWREYKSAVQRGLRAADLVITPTHAMLDALNENYPNCLKQKVVVIPNGLDPCSRSPKLKQKFILSAGRLWDEARNIHTLTGIARQLPWPICVAGDKQNIDDRNNASWARENCYMLEKLPAETLQHWYACASIYAFPARYDPFGLSVLEAGLSGCAMVLGEIPSLQENWEGAALFVNPEDRFALKYSLLELIKNECYRARLGRCARERAIEFTSTRMGEQYVNAYGSLLSRSTTKELATCA